MGNWSLTMLVWWSYQRLACWKVPTQSEVDIGQSRICEYLVLHILCTQTSYYAHMKYLSITSGSCTLYCIGIQSTRGNITCPKRFPYCTRWVLQYRYVIFLYIFWHCYCDKCLTKSDSKLLYIIIFRNYIPILCSARTYWNVHIDENPYWRRNWWYCIWSRCGSTEDNCWRRIWRSSRERNSMRQYNMSSYIMCN